MHAACEHTRSASHSRALSTQVRAIGLSNETPWGLLRFIWEARAGANLPVPVALQNAYSLTCRTFEARMVSTHCAACLSLFAPIHAQVGLAECCHREGISLLAYSPLAMARLSHTMCAYSTSDALLAGQGLLTGKYFVPGGAPPQARLNLYRGAYAEAEGRYSLTRRVSLGARCKRTDAVTLKHHRPTVRPAVEAYCHLAAVHGMSPATLALRFVLSHPATASALSGATEQEQLVELLAAAEAGPLPQEVLDAIDKIHERYPNPTP